MDRAQEGSSCEFLHSKGFLEAISRPSRRALSRVYAQYTEHRPSRCRTYRIELAFTPGPDAVRVRQLCSVRAGVNPLVVLGDYTVRSPAFGGRRVGRYTLVSVLYHGLYLHLVMIVGEVRHSV